MARTFIRPPTPTPLLGDTEPTPSQATSIAAVELTRDDIDNTNFIFLRFCDLLRRVTIGSGAAAVLANVLVLCRPPRQIALIALHLYGVLFGAVIVAIEWGPLERVAHAAPLLVHSWGARGLAYGFVGALLVALHADHGSHRPFWLKALLEVVGVDLIVTGATFTLLDLLCFTRLKASQEAQIKRRKLARANVQTLAAQREKIDQLIKDTECELQSL